MKYIIVDIQQPLYTRFIELDKIGSFMLGKRYSNWMLLQIGENPSTKKHIPWPEPFGDEPACVSDLEETLRKAIHS